MFDRIAPTYDLLNRVMTLRVDQLWRRRLVRTLRLAPGERLLDVCAGTMDVAAVARRQYPAARGPGQPTSPSPCSRAASAKTGLPASHRRRAPPPLPRRARSTPSPSPSACATSTATRSGSPRWPGCMKPGARLGVLEFFRPESTGLARLSRRVQPAGPAGDGAAALRRRRRLPLPGRVDGALRLAARVRGRRPGGPASATCGARPSSPACAGWSTGVRA